MDKSHLFSRTARKPRSERNCSGFFLCRGIIKRCTPLGSKCTPHRPFVKWYRGVKRKRLHGDNFRITVEPVIVKKYMKTLANRSFYKKKLDTNQDTHCIKIGVQLWSEMGDSNSRHLAPKASALPTALIPDLHEIFMGSNSESNQISLAILKTSVLYYCGFLQQPRYSLRHFHSP